MEFALLDQMLKSQMMCVPLKRAFPSVYKDILPPFSILSLRLTGSFFLGEGKQTKSKNCSCIALISHTSESQRA